MAQLYVVFHRDTGTTNSSGCISRKWPWIKCNCGLEEVVMMPKERFNIPLKGTGGQFDALWDGETTECRNCGESIGFAITKSGKWVPFDPAEDDSTPADVHFATCSARK